MAAPSEVIDTPTVAANTKGTDGIQTWFGLISLLVVVVVLVVVLWRCKKARRCMHQARRWCSCGSQDTGASHSDMLPTTHIGHNKESPLQTLANRRASRLSSNFRPRGTVRGQRQLQAVGTGSRKTNTVLYGVDVKIPLLDDNV